MVFVARRQLISGRLGRPPGDRNVVENGKKRRSTGDEGSSDAKLACLAADDDSDGGRRNSKKKGFSWNQYFSEEIGIAAPPRLFKNVRNISVTFCLIILCCIDHSSLLIVIIV